MYGNIHNEITYNGIIGLTVGENTIDMANNEIKVAIENKNKSEDENNTPLSAELSSNTLTFSFDDSAYATIDNLQILQEEVTQYKQDADEKFLTEENAESSYVTKAALSENYYSKEEIDNVEYVTKDFLTNQNYVTELNIAQLQAQINTLLAAVSNLQERITALEKKS